MQFSLPLKGNFKVGLRIHLFVREIGNQGKFTHKLNIIHFVDEDVNFILFTFYKSNSRVLKFGLVIMISDICFRKSQRITFNFSLFPVHFTIMFVLYIFLHISLKH